MVNITSHGASLLYHVTFQEIHTRRRKEVESKHRGTVKELTLEHQRLDRTEILFSLRKNGGYIHSSLGGRSILVVRQAGRPGDENLVVYRIFKILVTWLLMHIFIEYFLGLIKCIYQ